MGSVRGGPRRPNTTAYFVALAGILILLALLCCYFVYFCVKKVKELTREDSPLCQPQTSSPPRTAYPVQPVVRDSATAMAKLCKQIPAPGGKTDTVFPAASSPAATRTDTGESEMDTTCTTATANTSQTGSMAPVDETQDSNKVQAPQAIVQTEAAAVSYDAR